MFMRAVDLRVLYGLHHSCGSMVCIRVATLRFASGFWIYGLHQGCGSMVCIKVVDLWFASGLRIYGLHQGCRSMVCIWVADLLFASVLWIRIDQYWIRIQGASCIWIRICIQNTDPDPDPHMLIYDKIEAKNVRFKILN